MSHADLDSSPASYRFHIVSLTPKHWHDLLAQDPSSNVFQTPEWLAFLHEALGVEPVLAELKRGAEVCGLFVGGVFRKFGLRLLGSPFRGWSTPYMGLSLHPSADRLAAFRALEDLAFRQLRCVYFEVVDLHLTPADATTLGFEHEARSTYVIDLTRNEDEMLAAMGKTARNRIRNWERREIAVEEAHDAAFADDYAAQLRDVFAKQGLVPHFGAERVRSLIRHLRERVLLLRTRDQEGRCIATGIFPAANTTAYFWGGASWREHQTKRPNEILFWRAMLYWKQRGMRQLNLVGTMDYKAKFGGTIETGLMVSKARNRLLAKLRRLAPAAMKALLRLRYAISGSRPASQPTDA